MESDSDESTKFVSLIEEHKDVLIKSRLVELTKRKEAAAAEIIKKWTDIAGKTLTQVALYKKINNFKSRAKSASSSGKKLSDWQLKLLEIEGANFPTDEGEGVQDHSLINTDKISDANVTSESGAIQSGNNATSESGARQLLAEHETFQTKQLNNEQLQRLVLLKQVKVLTLQQQRLERLEGSVRIENEKDVSFEFVGWDRPNQN